MPVDTRVRRSDGELFDSAVATSAEAVTLPFHQGDHGVILGTDARELGQRVGLDVAEMLAGEKAEGAPGEVFTLPFGLDGRVIRGLLAGVGDSSTVAWRRAGAALARRLSGVTTAVVGLGGGGDDPSAPAPGPRESGAFVEGLLLASYTSRLTRDNGSAKSRPVADVHLVTPRTAQSPAEFDAAIDRAVVIARAVALARDLVNTPAATKTPQWLAEQAERVAGESALRVRIRGKDELRAEGFGGIVAVGAGSRSPPRLIEMTYEPEDARGHIVLIGKGITFDTGGLSLKPSESMRLMKTDMAGGGAVIAVLSALRALRVPYKITGLVAAAENMPSGSAQRPGDVITHYGGRTVEVFNTDAEGRLVLADALSYAADRLAPDTMVDVATLTGSQTVALGRTHAALYANDDLLAHALIDAGEAGGDRIWRMPLVDDYRDALDSDVADLSHIARTRYSAGSVIAALFLREFAGGVGWAHLDIAGPGRATSDDWELTKGGTGFGVRALLRWLSAPPR